ncbi:MAG: hypothetical protein ACT4PS_13250 [Betaproteobacteria bacterium]
MHKGRDGRQINTTGVRIERNDRHCVVYRGTRTALIEAGLAGPEHFPDVNRRLTWHFPKAGANWGIRRRAGGVYSLTKLKDRCGLVDAELEAFQKAAVAEARRDPAFQRFLAGVGRASETGARDMRLRPATAAFAAMPALRPAARTSGLEAIAVATLLVGVTLYFWSRQA